MNFTINSISGEMHVLDSYKKCHITGKINENVKNKQISYIAARSPNRMASYYGSGHPHPNMSIAFDGTKTKGIIKLNENNEFELIFDIPNSYYVHLGSFLIPPILYISYNNGFVQKNEKIYIGKGIPYRTLTYSEQRDGVMFYNGLTQLPVRSQEQILVDGKYILEDENHKSFWGLKPPV